MRPIDPKALASMIAALPADRMAEVHDFVEFLLTRGRDSALTAAATAASAPAFAAVWENSEDDVYDAL